MAIVTAEVSIEGLRPLLFHVFGPDSIPLEKVERTGVAGNDPEEWRRTYTATEQGQLYLRGDYMYSCLINAARYSKAKRGTLMTAMAASLQMLDDILLLDRWMPPEPLPTSFTEPVYLDIRSVVNPSTKGRGIRYRVACCPGWHLSFRCLWDVTLINRAQFKTILGDAGLMVGLADGRSRGNGRFQFTSLEFSDGE